MMNPMMMQMCMNNGNCMNNMNNMNMMNNMNNMNMMNMMNNCMNNNCMNNMNMNNMDPMMMMQMQMLMNNMNNGMGMNNCMDPEAVKLYKQQQMKMGYEFAKMIKKQKQQQQSGGNSGTNQSPTVSVPPSTSSGGKAKIKVTFKNGGSSKAFTVDNDIMFMELVEKYDPNKTNSNSKFKINGNEYKGSDFRELHDIGLVNNSQIIVC